jgi:hypothetical protein
MKGDSMKKLILVVVLFLAFAGVATGSSVNGDYNGNPIVKVKVNGLLINSDTPAMIIDGTTLIPLRAASEALGATVTWDQNTYTASLQINPPSASSQQISDVSNFKSFITAAKSNFAQNGIPVSDYSVNVDDKGVYLNAILDIDTINQQNLSYNLALIAGMAIVLKNYNTDGTIIQTRKQGVLTGQVAITTADALDFANKKITFDQFVNKWSIKTVSNQNASSVQTMPIPDNTAMCKSINDTYDTAIHNLQEELGSRGIGNSSIFDQQAKSLNEQRNSQLKSFGCPVN